jgi:threonine dehydratase
MRRSAIGLARQAGRVTGTSVLSGGDAAAVVEARSRLRGVVRHTPLQSSTWLSERAGVPVHLKLECWQRTNAFKIRGALNAVATLEAGDRTRGLVAASAGNHGQALALAASLYGATATVFVPRSAPQAKRSRIRRHGAEIQEVSGTYNDAASAARAFAARTGARMVHPFNDPAVVAGQGTVALEILEDLPEVRHMVVPVGGGGLLAGVGAVAVSPGNPSIGVLGVQSVRTRAMHEALLAQRVVPTPVTPTLCDGLAGETEVESFERVRRVVDRVHLVEEEAVAAAIRGLFREEGVVAEGSGAVGVAAILAGTLELEGPTAVIITGGNIDASTLIAVLAED